MFGCRLCVVVVMSASPQPPPSPFYLGTVQPLQKKKSFQGDTLNCHLDDRFPAGQVFSEYCLKDNII